MITLGLLIGLAGCSGGGGGAGGKLILEGFAPGRVPSLSGLRGGLPGDTENARHTQEVLRGDQ
jgi:hypothetical protein